MAHSGTINVAASPGLGKAFNGQSRLAVSRGRRTLAPMNAVKEVFMPALSSTMTEGKIVTWLKSPGDKVTKGESIVVVESGKFRQTCVAPIGAQCTASATASPAHRPSRLAMCR